MHAKRGQILENDIIKDVVVTLQIDMAFQPKEGLRQLDRTEHEIEHVSLN